jgi:cyclopropane fatty-acyl-phospholipid synthase-like methyltransferase
MKTVSRDLLIRMAESLDAEDCAEMAIPSYLHANPLLRWMAWLRVKVLAKSLVRLATADRRQRADRAILDFGCGAGVLLPTAADLAGHIYAVDIVPAPARMLVESEKLSGVEVLTPDELDQHVADAGIDYLLAGEVFEHIEDLPDCLARLRAKLKPDGRLLVTLPTENWAYRVGRWLAGFDGHYHMTDAKDIHATILANGFREMEVRKLPSPLLPSIYWYADYALAS